MAEIDDTEAPRADPRFAILLLAAGRSSRSGDIHKLLARRDGIALVTRVAAGLRPSRAATRLAVVGHAAEDVRHAIEQGAADFSCVHAPDFGEGLSASLRAGIAALPAEIDAVVVCLADMPAIDAAAVDRLIAAHAPTTGRDVVVATCDGRRGNPVLLPRRLFGPVMRLTGDVGARGIVAAQGDAVTEIDLGHGARLDLDTLDALRAEGYVIDGQPTNPEKTR